MADQKKYTNKLAGKRILIVGGSAGIGYGVAEGSVENGATVIISSSQQSRVDGAIASLEKSYPSAKGRVSGYAVDLSTESQLEENVAKLLQQAGKLDHIVYTAGDRLAQKPLKEATLAELKQGGMVRFFAPFMLVKTAFANDHLNPGPTSSITLTTGGISQRPRKDWSLVSGYAGGLHSLTRNLALELAPIRVNLVSPGAVDTPLWDRLARDERERLYAELGSKMPTGRVGNVEDIAHAYLFLMQDANCTGTVVDSNGGILLV